MESRPVYVSGCITHREDYFAAVGESAPDSYDDLLRAGRKLKKTGYPLGRHQPNHRF
jgi:hypothetical protein